MSHVPIIHVPSEESAKPPTAIRRCAIYARVSVSNKDSSAQLSSLQAQVQACESYIQSQRSMGWELVATPYIDDGYSGGNLDRPSLIQLMQDVGEGKFDAVIVQRLDRLCRSVRDICDLLPLFSTNKTALVSLTQAFDSETPTGRLTLHLLTTFGQFERELAGERVRDKFAITRASGRWQRSGIPLGYTLTDQQELQVNATEAAMVRDIFQRYLAADSMTQLLEDLSALDYRTKIHISRNGNQHGGKHFDRNTLNQLLRNRAYVGEVFYKDAWHPGKHEPIIDRALWDQVQAVRSQRARRTGRPTGDRFVEDFPLAGLVFWHDGSAYTMYESSNRKGQRYRYYKAPKTTLGQPDDSVVLVRNLAIAVGKLLLHTLHSQLGNVSEFACDDRQVVTLADFSRDPEFFGDLFGIFELALFRRCPLPNTTHLVTALPDRAALPPVQDEFTFAEDVCSLFFCRHSRTLNSTCEKSNQVSVQCGDKKRGLLLHSPL